MLFFYPHGLVVVLPFFCEQISSSMTMVTGSVPVDKIWTEKMEMKIMLIEACGFWELTLTRK